MLRKYYGDNYDKAMSNSSKAVQEAKDKLWAKYPNATRSKFEFEPELEQSGDVRKVIIYFINNEMLSTDITSNTFKNDKRMWVNLHNNSVYAVEKSKAELWAKYPNATRSKFSFEPEIEYGTGEFKKVNIFFINSETVSTDITSSTFLNDKGMNIFLTNGSAPRNPNSKFPLIWQGGGAKPKLLLTEHIKVPGLNKYDDLKPADFIRHHFPPMVVNYKVNNFKIYVNDKNYFMSEFPEMRNKMATHGKGTFTRTKGYHKTGTFQDKKQDWMATSWSLAPTYDYYQQLTASYIATYKCGISLQHLSESKDVHPIVTAIMRFHYYFTIRRIMYEMQGINAGKEVAKYIQRYGATDIRNYVPLKSKQPDPEQFYVYDLQNDFKRFCPLASSGITNDIGYELLNQSIEVFMYAICGAQARIKQPIYSNRGSSREAQNVFREIVEDAVINYSTSVWVNNMNKAITDCNIYLNIAISPSLWLVSNSLIILKEPIPGYNNNLKVADDTGMHFGINDGLNYHEVSQ